MSCVSLRRVVALFAFGLLLVAGALPAWAGEEEEARASFERGVELYSSGKFEEAAAEFERAHALRPSFKILYNLALAENELGHFAAAFRCYTRYLEEGGFALGPERIALVQQELTRLEGLTAYLLIQGGPRDALVLVDNEETARLPLQTPLLVDVGRRTVAVEHQGKRLLERVVRLAGKETLLLEVALPEAPIPAVPAPLPSAEDRRELPPWPFWVAAGLTLASAGGLVAFDIATQRAYDAAEAHPEAKEHERDFVAYQTAEWVMVGATAVTGITAVVLAFFTRFRSKETGAAIVPLPGGVALCAGRSF